MNAALIRKKILLLVFACATISGLLNAQPKDYYVPKANLVPAHYEPQQFFASLAYNGGLDLSLSYSLPLNLALFASGGADFFPHSRKESLEPRYTIYKNDYNASAGLGYFRHRKYKKINVIEIYAGVSTTHVDNYRRSSASTTENADVFTEAEYISFFGQTNLMLRRPKYDLYLSTRFSYNQFDDFSYYTRAQTITYSAESTFKVLNLKPSLGFSYVMGKVKFNAQAGVSVPLFTEEAKIISSAGGDTSNESFSDVLFIWHIAIQYASLPYDPRRR